MLLVSPERNSSAKTFEELLSPETIIASGFTPGEISSVVRKGGEVYNLRSTFISGNSGTAFGLHLVVGERLGKRRNWYFGTFQGPYWDHMNQENIEEYTKMEVDILIGANIISGETLDERIRKVVRSFMENEFPSSLG